MKYVVLNADNSVAYTFEQTINDTKLYSYEFLNACLLLDDSVNTPRGYIYNWSTATFTEPPVIEQPVIECTEPITVEGLSVVTHADVAMLYAQITSLKDRVETLEGSAI